MILMVSMIIVSIIIFRWHKERKNGLIGEEVIKKVIMDLCFEPIRNMKEFTTNIKNTFKK